MPLSINPTTRERLIHAGIDAETSAWPDPIKEKDPGEDADLQARAQWFQNYADTADALAESEDVDDEDAVQEFLESRNAARSESSTETRSNGGEETSPSSFNS